jgi:predicted RNase H-like HicB family nuclease
MTTYIALLRKDADSDFGVDFPDFPGCVTAGSTIDEAFAMAHEALDGHIQAMIAGRLDIPAPSSIDAILADPDNAGAVPLIVSATVTQPRIVRINITLPEDLLADIDRAADNRSRFLANAARNALNAAA